jgi:hypothetical protein
MLNALSGTQAARAAMILATGVLRRALGAEAGERPGCVLVPPLD